MIGPALVLMKSVIRSPIMTAVAAGPRARTHGMMPVGNRHDREVADAAAATTVAAQAFGPSSASRPASVHGPRALLITTSYPYPIAARAGLPPTSPLWTILVIGHDARPSTTSSWLVPAALAALALLRTLTRA